MSVAHVLLGLLSLGEQYGYELKHGHDDMFRNRRPLAFGQVYAALDRLAQRGLAEVVDTVRVDGPERRVYRLTEAGHEALMAWLDEVEEPAEFVANPFAVKTTLRLLATDPATTTRHLQRQRAAHGDRMRELTRSKTDPNATVADVLAADYALAHLAADVNWLEAAIERLADLARDVEDVTVTKPGQAIKASESGS